MISLANAAVYQTPGFVNKSNDISSEVPISTDIQLDSTDENYPFWIFFIVIITIAAIYVQIKFLLKKRRIKKKKGLVPDFVEGALKNMEKAKDISKTPEEFDKLISELGLEEVKDKIIKNDENENKRRNFRKNK